MTIWGVPNFTCDQIFGLLRWRCIGLNTLLTCDVRRKLNRKVSFASLRSLNFMNWDEVCCRVETPFPKIRCLRGCLHVQALYSWRWWTNGFLMTHQQSAHQVIHCDEMLLRNSRATSRQQRDLAQTDRTSSGAVDFIAKFWLQNCELCTHLFSS